MHEQTAVPVAAPPGAVDEELHRALARHRALLDAGVSFPGVPTETLPWLMATEPFVLTDQLKARIEDLGRAVFAFIDAVQQMYSDDDPTVRDHLDPCVPGDLRGRDLDRWIRTFRLDLTLHRGHPVLTEIEEVYGNAGKAFAMQLAYGVSSEELFRFFADLELSHVLIDDSVRSYDSELSLLQRALADLHGQHVEVGYFSSVKPSRVRAAWRFCYTADLAQYDPTTRASFLDAGITYVNPLFHAYGMKALLGLVWHEAVEGTLCDRMGSRALGILRRGVPKTELVRELDQDAVLVHRRNLVLKVASSPQDSAFTWGSRGVFFGESSARRWAHLLKAVRDGHLPDRPDCAATYLLMALVDGDRRAVRYLHPELDRVEVMARARMRIAPIFVRDEHRGEGRLVAGHVTFVNTSRKVHLGRHAVCAPLDWSRDG